MFSGSWNNYMQIIRTSTESLTYTPSHLQRNLPARGFKPATLLALGGGVMLYGWYQFGKGAREQR